MAISDPSLQGVAAGCRWYGITSKQDCDEDTAADCDTDGDETKAASIESPSLNEATADMLDPAYGDADMQRLLRKWRKC